ncbi:hypothetical protein [Thalassobaculum sp.]|uniref:hypothetical protein n=1 Tax=Thalassobaculum sp. TaxID=2022740 RepID=UPI0032EF6D08
MTSPTLEGALALEAAAGRSRIADAYRAGYAAALEAAAVEASGYVIVSLPETAEERAATKTARSIYDAIRALPIPEADHDR